MIDPFKAPTRTFSVRVSFDADNDLFAEEVYAIDATNPVEAEHLAIERSDDSTYWRPCIDGISRSASASESVRLAGS
jgi:hypothetical protein